MSRLVGWFLVVNMSFPRVSGDEPPPTTASRMTLLFSPRERG